MGKTIFAVILFGLAGAIFFLYTEPTYSGTGSLQAQISQYNLALSKAQQLDALKTKLVNQYNSMDPAQISRLETMLPDSVDNIGLILDLNNLAARYGLALENVDVSTPGSSAAQTGAVGGTGSGSQKYDSLGLQFATYGTYDQFRSFLVALEQSLRMVDLQTLSITRQSTTGGAGGLYRYDMTLKTYWLK
jgi:Tfp pilus assembly protein PilO